MQYIIRYDVEPQRSEEFRTWLVENDDAIKSSARSGWAYLGTWFTVQGFGSYQTESRWEIDDYAALGADWTEQGGELTRQWFGYVDQGRPVETYLMKSASDVVILE